MEAQAKACSSCLGYYCPPTTAPTSSPTTSSPTLAPSGAPTDSPTAAPTAAPTTQPTSPTSYPTSSPTPTAPTKRPTLMPTATPTNACADGTHHCWKSGHANLLATCTVGAGMVTFASVLLTDQRHERIPLTQFQYSIVPSAMSVAPIIRRPYQQCCRRSPPHHVLLLRLQCIA
jgi:hypothetical protein